MASGVSDRPSGDPEDDSPPDLVVTVHADPDGVMLVLAGEVDMGSVPTLSAYLDQVAADTFESVVVDLAAVTFLDSSGLAVLARAKQRLTTSSRRFGVQNPSANVRRVLTISGIDTLIIDAAS